MKYRHVMDHFAEDLPREAMKLLKVKDIELVVKYLGSEAIQKQKVQAKSSLEQAEKIRKEISMTQANVDHDRRRRLVLQKEMEQLRLAEVDLEECVRELNTIRFTDSHEEMYPALNGIDDLVLLLDTCSAAERASAETCMALDSSKLWRDRILKKSRQKIPDGRNFVRRCPCCDKGLTSDDTLRFESNIDDLFKSNLATDDLISRANDLYNRIKVISARVTTSASIARGFSAQRAELTQINQRLSGIDDRIDMLRRQESQLNDEIDRNRKNELELEKCVLELSTLHSQWFTVTQKYEEVKIKRQRQLEIIAPGGGLGGRSMQDVEDELRRHTEDKQDLQTKKTRLEEDLNRMERQSLALKSSLSDKERVLMEVIHRMSRASELEEKLRSLETNERAISSSKASKVRDRSLQERTVAKMEAEEQAEKASHKRQDDAIRENFNNCQNARNRIVTATKAHMTTAKRCEEMNLGQIDRELDSMKAEIISIERSLSDLHPKISTLENQMNQQDHTKRMISDNISARSARQEAIELFTKLHEIESKLESRGSGSSMSLQELQRQLQRHHQNKQSLEKEKHGLIVSHPSLLSLPLRPSRVLF